MTLSNILTLYFPVAEIQLNCLIVLLIGFSSGILSGLLGIGGGFISTPLLTGIGVSAPVAVATSAHQIIGASFSSILPRLRPRKVDFKLGLILAFSGVAGAYTGTRIFILASNLGELDILIACFYIILMSFISVTSFKNYFKKESLGAPPHIKVFASSSKENTLSLFSKNARAFSKELQLKDLQVQDIHSEKFNSEDTSSEDINLKDIFSKTPSSKDIPSAIFLPENIPLEISPSKDIPSEISLPKDIPFLPKNSSFHFKALNFSSKKVVPVIFPASENTNALSTEKVLKENIPCEMKVSIPPSTEDTSSAFAKSSGARSKDIRLKDLQPKNIPLEASLLKEVSLDDTPSKNFGLFSKILSFFLGKSASKRKISAEHVSGAASEPGIEVPPAENANLLNSKAGEKQKIIYVSKAPNNVKISSSLKSDDIIKTSDISLHASEKGDAPKADYTPRNSPLEENSPPSLSGIFKAESKLGKKILKSLRISFKVAEVECFIFTPILLGAFTGMLVVIMGVGGGFILVPAMISIMKIKNDIAVGTSLLQIFLITIIVVIFHIFKTGLLDILLGTLLIIGATTGAQISSIISLKIGKKKIINLLLAILTLSVAIKFASDLFFYKSQEKILIEEL